MDVFDFETTDDIQISNGDWSIKESTNQHIEHVLNADKGQFRQFPLIGLGIRNLLNSALSIVGLKQAIKLSLRADDNRVTQIRIDKDFNIGIDAERLR